MYETIHGGFTIRDDDQPVIAAQRAITKQVNERFIQVGAVFLRTSGKMPIDDNWSKSNFKDTNLQDWIDQDEKTFHNVGFNLQMGWVDVDIDTPDPEYNRCLLAAMRHLGIDTRFSFGRRSATVATHVLVQLGEEEASNFELLGKFIPKEFRIDGGRYHVELRSYPTNTTEKNLYKSAKQTVMPGSLYSHKSNANEYDLSVWWKGDEIAPNVTSIAATTPRRVNFNELVRAITFATFLYVLRDHWVEGNRQGVATKVAGWLARVVADSQAMNNHEVISQDVWCPIDTDDIVESLIKFVCEFQGDEEPHMRIRTYYDAQAKLERNPDAKIPGWPALEQLLGGERTNALRTVFTPGSDVSILSTLAERYIYDETDSLYIDRKRHALSGNFAHPNDELKIRHKGDVVRIGGKPKEAFLVFESSDMRKRVDQRDMFPDLPAGGIFRIGDYGDVVEEDDGDSGSSVVFNTWRGWPIKPTEIINAELMAQCVTYLDKLLSYLTRDNAQQVEWVKQNTAYTIQNPGKKQQIAWVNVGGQGVGKSFFGNVFMKALFGYLWGSASPKVMEGAFSVEPFINKMFVFIDEAKFSGDASTDEIKKLIRNVDIGGAEKFGSSRNYRIYSRVMFASNRFDINVGQTGVVDRALFYTKAYDKDHLNMTEMQFKTWAETLKPWFEEYAQFIARRDVREHYMRYFMELPVSKLDVESIKHSSANDHAIIAANMSWTRRVAKYIIEEGRIYEDLSIEYPFTAADLNKRVMDVARDMGLKSVQGQRVLHEFEEAGMIERVKDGIKSVIRFTHKHGDLVKTFGDVYGVEMFPGLTFGDDDFGVNECKLADRRPWRGGKATKF